MKYLTYLTVRAFGFFVGLLPYSAIHALGRISGSVAYSIHRPFRKKAMTNLSIAFGATKSEEELKRIAKSSFQNLMITLLEFFRLKRSRGHFDQVVTLKDRHNIIPLLKDPKQGVVFLSGHQGNWEIPFTALTDHFAGIAIGRPIKNKWLYKWILSVREMNGGKIFDPRQALKQGALALKRGEFVGIVGDQALPQSNYSYPLFGTRAWTTSAPALLAYKTNSPLVVGTTRRISQGRYTIEGSSPLWPDTTKPIREEVPRLMNAAMKLVEESILEKPQQWLWQHDRWKQQTINHVKREYRYAFALIILPENPTPYLSILPLLRKILDRTFLTLLSPIPIEAPGYDIIIQDNLQLHDWRYQLVLDFTNTKSLQRHYKRLGAFQTLSLDKMQKMTKEKALVTTVTKALVKPECLTLFED